ncbi:MAG: hypothetical protein NTV86_09665 [Planctomycetota bacterium]|nr:hypothetical protein [Planctomycetota bacterium]
MERPLSAQTFNEARYYLEVTPCPSCGRGPLTPEPGPRPPANLPVPVNAVCSHCRSTHSFVFLCRHELPPTGVDSEIINPTDRPGDLLDLGQWLSLFYSLIGLAGRQGVPIIARRLGYQASLCLSEALKFYRPGEELPPAEAFFHPDSQAAFRNAPEKFTRTRLLGLRDRLPSPDRMADRLRADEAPAPRRWYQFWK